MLAGTSRTVSTTASSKLCAQNMLHWHCERSCAKITTAENAHAGRNVLQILTYTCRRAVATSKLNHCPSACLLGNHTDCRAHYCCLPYTSLAGLPQRKPAPCLAGHRAQHRAQHRSCFLQTSEATISFAGTSRTCTCMRGHWTATE
jgi:hypothetical protein